MSRRYRAAIIGLGTIGRRMLTNIPKQGRLEVAGGWDLSDDACARTKAEFPSLALAENAQELIASPDVDVVYVGTPPGAHAEYVRTALASGKAVFCEKPLGIDLAESRALTQEVLASGLPAAVNLSLAGARGLETIREAMGSESMGAVLGADIRLRFSHWPRLWQAEARWLARREQGGFMREVATHFVYLADALLGPMTLQTRDRRYPDDPFAAETHVLARLESGGVPVTLAGSVGGAGPDLVEFTLWGEARSFRFTDFYKLWTSDGGAWEEAAPDLENPALDAYLRQLDGLAAVLDGDADALPGFPEALRAQEIIETILA